MTKVFAVYYDNGTHYLEDNDVHIVKVYASKDKADAFVKERMDAINTSKEDFFHAYSPRFFVNEYDVEQ